MSASVYSDFDQETLDREYSPSSCVDNIKVHLEQYRVRSLNTKTTAISNGSCFRDLTYGESADETLDLFLPDAAKGGPLQVYIHGGYWQALGKEESSFAAPMFQSQGSFFAVLNYSLAPSVSLTEIVAQNRRAIAWLYDHAHQWGVDRDRIYLSGSSAGAHLAIMMLLTDWASYGLPEDVIKGVCAASGIYDLEPIRLSYVNDLLSMDATEALANSPIRHSLRNQCPIILAHGDNETSEFKRQTREYQLFLQQAGVSAICQEIPERNHFNVIFDLGDADTWLGQQVLRQMGLIGPCREQELAPTR